MNHTWKKLAGVFLLASLVCLNVSQARAEAKAPDFALPAIQDKKIVDLNKLKGKVVLITFWATWCGPCVQEIPSLISLQKEFGPRGLEVIGVSMDQSGEGPVLKVIDKTGINYPVVMDDSKVSRDFGGIFGLPASFLIDRSGTVRKRFDGWTSHEAFVENIEQALK